MRIVEKGCYAKTKNSEGAFGNWKRDKVNAYKVHRRSLARRNGPADPVFNTVQYTVGRACNCKRLFTGIALLAFCGIDNEVLFGATRKTKMRKTFKSSACGLLPQSVV